MNLPPSWSKMTRHNQACYLVNTHQAKNYRDAQHKIGPVQRPVQAQKPAPRPAELWYNKD